MTHVKETENTGSIINQQAAVYYCYDALCGWCYGFTPEIKKLEASYQHELAFEVLSGGMVMPDNAKPIGQMAKYLATAYKEVESLTGARFGEDYLWHIFNPDKSDWLLDSEKPAIALSILKENCPSRAIEIAADLQYAHMFEGRDLTDPEAYRHLLPKYEMEWEAFNLKLQRKEHMDKAYEDFALVKQLQVAAYPAVLLQVSDAKFYLIAQGYTTFDVMRARIEKVLADVKQDSLI